MYTDLHWVAGPWPGKLAVSARPRGGDWLEEELASWHDSGVDVVVSLLTTEEAVSLDLQNEAVYSGEAGVVFRSFPIVDRSVPANKSGAMRFVGDLDADLSAGRNVTIHCRQGIGRTGLIAASLLISRGLSVAEATERVSMARGLEVPETAEQLAWLHAAVPELSRLRAPVA